MDFLTNSLDDPRLASPALRTIRNRPEVALHWALSLGPALEQVVPGSREERIYARMAMAFSSFPPAAPWLTACQQCPDELALEAAASLALQGTLAEEDLRWSAGARPGPAADRAIERWEIESGARAAIRPDGTLSTELAPLIGSRAMHPIIEGLQNGTLSGVQALPAIEALGNAGLPAAVPSLCPLVTSGHPLIAGAAAHALGQIGSERAVPWLLRRRPTRGSDADQAVLHALAAIGDLRAAGYLAARIRPIRSEEVMEAEIAVLRAIGGPVRLAIGDWLDAPSAAARAVAETVLLEMAPAAVTGWISGQPPDSRVEQLCARLLLPGVAGSAASIKAEADLAVAVHAAGSPGITPLVHGLQVSSGPAEAAFVRVLHSLRLPGSILQVFRIPRAAEWKLSIPLAIGPAAIPALRVAAIDPEQYVARAAGEALAILAPGEGAVGRPSGRKGKR
jgi:hypothetical protein